MSCSTKANVYDINNLDISNINNEVFVVDTNVLYWMHYSRCHMIDRIGYQGITYPKFIQDLIKNNNRVVTSACNVSELVHLIEKKEHDIYKNINSAINKKQFRSIPSERVKVKSELESVLLQINSIYNVEDMLFSFSEMDAFVSTFENHKCDCMDYAVINHVKNNGMINFITDDSDCITMDNINIYTANNFAISSARTEGKLINP